MLDSMQSILGPRHLGQDARLSEAQRHHSPLNDGLERNYSLWTLFLSCKATSYFAMSTVDKLQLWTSADSNSSDLKIWLKFKNNWASHCECWAAEGYSTRSQQCYKLTDYVENNCGESENLMQKKRLIWGCKAVCVNIFLLTAKKSQMNFFCTSSATTS